MHRCPTPSCRHRLRRKQVGRDVYWSCGICHGRAVSINSLAKRNVALAQEIVRDVEVPQLQNQKYCPFCGRGMGLSYNVEHCRLELDYCAPCQAVWFDPGETDGLPESDIQKHLRHSPKAPSRPHFKFQVPDQGWQYAATFIGLPAESHARPMDGQPVLTWVIGVFTILVSITAFSNPGLKLLSFIPAEPWRFWGATFLTSFFLHGGWFHLISNMYFLWVFGDDTEDYLGHFTYLALLVLATLGGNFCVMLLRESPNVPHIGASGGIFGVLTFYLLNFPKSRITFFKFFLWMRVSPFLALIYMLGVQVIGAWLSANSGFTAVSYGSHLGGAAVGVCFWFLFGEGRFDPEQAENAKFKSYK